MDMVKRILKSDYFIIVTLYSLAHGLILLNDGVFWDGWCSFNQTPETMLAFTRELGGEFLRYIISFLLLSEYGVSILRIMTFFSFLFASLLLYNILVDIKEIDRFSRLIIVLFFALFPINEARITIAVAVYSLSYGLFFLGFWMIAKYVQTKHTYFRILGLILFFLSFSTNSLLAFILVPLFYLTYLDKISITGFKSFFSVLFKYVDLISLPVVYWILKQTFWVGEGFYYGYNQPQLKNMIMSPLFSINWFNSSFLTPIVSSLYGSIMLSNYFFLILFFVLWIFRNCRPEVSVKPFRLFITGSFIFFLGSFPYIVIGRTGSMGEWHTRNELLLPLGAAIAFYYMVKLFFDRYEFRQKHQVIIYSIILSAFITKNIFVYVDFQRDWFKQLSIIENIKNSYIISENHCFLFDDLTQEYNAIRRTYRFYEYNGLMKKGLGGQSRLGVRIQNYNNDILTFSEYKPYAHYNFSEFDFRDPEYKIIINHGESSSISSSTSIIKLLIYKYLRPDYFIEEIKNVVKIEYERL